MGTLQIPSYNLFCKFLVIICFVIVNMAWTGNFLLPCCPRQNSESECWRFYAVPTARVIFTAKTSFDLFSLSQEQVWTFSDLGDRIYEMRCPFVVVGLNARFIVLPHWDNMS